ncbi:7TM diverse intracellular signaling domain-containing protein [Sulfurimonas sp.]|uniref:7TM diverse intracellular signaling domain-containing protein n=1 Tax=Sulfurimonas sp. TaxID=2022749 RepID=UPI003D09EC4D
MKVAIQIFFMLFLSVSLHAYKIDQSTSNVYLLDKSEIFLDHTNSLTKEQIFSQQFSKNTQKVINLGIAPDTALWTKFTLKNTTNKQITKVLEYENSETEDILFYDGNNTIIDGMFHHRTSRDSLNPAFKITLQPFEEKTYFIKGHCKISTFVMKLVLWNEADFFHHNYQEKIYLLIFFTILVTLLVYNFMLLLFTKDVVYLYYLLYLVGVILFESIYLGVAQLYLFTNEISEFVTKATVFYIIILVIPMILFAIEFLKTIRFPKIHKFLKFYLYILPVIALLSFDNFLFTLNIMPIFFPLAIVMVYVGFHAYKAGTKEAIVYLIGWTFLIISLVLSVIQSLGWYNVFEHFRHINELAFTLEAFTFSIALAYRIKRLNAQKNTLNQKLIELQKNEQQRLQQLVQQQTKDLQASLEEKELLYQELQHRVKNNLAMVISLLQLQINQISQSEVKTELIIASNRINSFAKLYELLHLKDNSQELFTEVYFTNIIQNIQMNFKKTVKTIYDIKYNISPKDSIYCGLILNELVTNSFKYAFDKNGTISISVYKENNHIIMSVADNGSGYDESKTKNSLGLTIIETLSTKQLHASINKEIDNGTKVTLKWEEKG